MLSLGGTALQPLGACRGDGDRMEVEARLELGHPLLDEVRRAQHDEPLDVAAVEQLAGDERGLDGLADADVVGDEQAHRVELQRHEQRHELVGARLDRDLAEAAERAGAAPQRQQQRVAQEQRSVVAAELAFTSGRGKRASRTARLEGQVDEGLVLLGAGDGAHAQRLGGAAREHHPLAPAGTTRGCRG
jgi:hypothetical protein